MYAHKVDTRPRGATSTPDVPAARAERRWPRHRRLVFLAGAAALCWALPLLGYVLVSS